MAMPERVQPVDDELRAWDWRAELERQERSMVWLARHTGRSYSAVTKFAWGKLTPSVEWLRRAAQVLGKAVPS